MRQILKSILYTKICLLDIKTKKFVCVLSKKKDEFKGSKLWYQRVIIFK